MSSKILKSQISESLSTLFTRTLGRVFRSLLYPVYEKQTKLLRPNFMNPIVFFNNYFVSNSETGLQQFDYHHAVSTVLNVPKCIFIYRYIHIHICKVSMQNR